MALSFKRHQKISLRDNPSFCEKWLHDQICEDTSLLGLGELDVIDREAHSLAEAAWTCCWPIQRQTHATNWSLCLVLLTQTTLSAVSSIGTWNGVAIRPTTTLRF